MTMIDELVSIDRSMFIFESRHVSFFFFLLVIVLTYYVSLRVMPKIRIIRRSCICLVYLVFLLLNFESSLSIENTRIIHTSMNMNLLFRTIDHAVRTLLSIESILSTDVSVRYNDSSTISILVHTSISRHISCTRSRWFSDTNSR
jgi:hypothetical protein